MDFLFTPEQDEAAALVAEILADKATVERMKAVEAAGDRFDRELWATLGDAFDWSELDLIELARVLVEVGRKVAPVPLASPRRLRRVPGRPGPAGRRRGLRRGGRRGAGPPPVRADRGRRRTRAPSAAPRRWSAPAWPRTRSW